MNEQNLKPFKKGHKKLGGKQKGYKHTATILKEMLSQDPEEFLAHKDEQRNVFRELKKRGIETIKDLLMFRMVADASNGDKKAIGWLIRQIAEDNGTNINLRNSDIDVTKLSNEQLQSIVRGEGFGGTGTQEEE